MAILEGSWNCAQCGTKGIPGLTHTCPLCGDPHNDQLDPSEGFYLQDGASEVTDDHKLALANSGAKWNCGYCGAANLGSSKQCVSCDKQLDHDDFTTPVTVYVGGVMAEGVGLDDPDQLEEDGVDATLKRADPLQQLQEGPVVHPVRTLPSSSLPREGKPQYSITSDAIAGLGVSYGSAQPATKRQTVRIVAAVLAFLALIALGFWVHYEFIATHPVKVTVQSLAWEQQIEVEELRTLTQEDWSVPSDGRILSSWQEIRSYRKVLDHYEKRSRQVSKQVYEGTRSESYACGSRTVNRGNGSYESTTEYCQRSVPVYRIEHSTEYYDEPVYRDEPVYDTKYRYQIDRWVSDHWDKASDNTHGPKPIWPEPTIRHDKQRVGQGRSENYVATLLDEEGRSFTKDASESDWSELVQGRVLEGQQTRRGGLVSVIWRG